VKQRGKVDPCPQFGPHWLQDTFSCVSLALISGALGKTFLLLFSWGDGAQEPPGPSTAERRDERLFVEVEISLEAPERFVGRAWDAWDMWSSQANIPAECRSVRREEKQEPVPRSYFKAVPLEPFDMDSTRDRVLHNFIAHTSM